MQTILEYLKKREKQRYGLSEEDLDNPDEVIKWLKRNIKTQYAGYGMAEREQCTFGRPSYIIAKHDPSNKKTWFVAVSDGQTFVMRIRTTDDYPRIGIADERFLLLKPLDSSCKSFTHIEVDAQTVLEYLDRLKTE